MTKHIFTACLGTETHTWAPLPTNTKAFETSYLVRNGNHPAMVNMFGTPLQIWRDRAETKGWQVTEGLCAFATPSGLTVKSTYETLRNEFFPFRLFSVILAAKRLMKARILKLTTGS